MDKQIMIYAYCGILPSKKKEWTIDTHTNMDESQNNYTEPDKRSAYYMIPLIYNSREDKFICSDRKHSVGRDGRKES